DIICYGGSAGEINLSVSGGNAPYRIAWSDGVTTEDRTALAAGAYQVTVTDANNCTAVVSVTISQPAIAFNLSHTKTDVLCSGSSTASIDLKVTGGFAPYTYAWDNGKSSEDLAGLSAGSYTVTV
ncbi:SprB repeat-containing protein, partial [Daejeonella sp.]|uniref:SprB repeat-containing protein n=1 Tax=Daejeonella sp. TaxID=2805397 RepID=UPI0030C3BBAC